MSIVQVVSKDKVKHMNLFVIIPEHPEEPPITGGRLGSALD